MALLQITHTYLRQAGACELFKFAYLSGFCYNYPYMKQENIRNFCIIAHIDHGKSTLADRFLELSGTVEKRRMREQLLDTMDIERERGITIKLQPVRMNYKGHELNLIDTPGHVDFSYEVSRSLAACEGAILVVDATQGVQAQTLANVNLAREANLKLIPVVNKIDLPAAQPEDAAAEIKKAFGFQDDEILFASGKSGEGVADILQAVIDRVPAPEGSEGGPLQALIFDSVYDKHRGVIVFVRVVNGKVNTGDQLQMAAAQSEAEALEVGFFSPALTASASVGTGQIGYIVTGLRELGSARVGDTITHSGRGTAASLPGYREVHPMVYASIFPVSADEYPVLRDAMQKLKLSDASLIFEPENIPSIGFGFRTGFLGLLHMEIVQERLNREFGLDLVLTAPSVSYQVKKNDGQETMVYNPSQLPDPGHMDLIREPWVALDILTPEKYMGAIMKLAVAKRGIYKDTAYLSPGRVTLVYEIPLANLISDFYDKLKSSSQGYASMNYRLIDYREADLVKVDIVVAGEKADPLSFITHASKAESEGRNVVGKLKELIPKQQFAVALQAAIGGKIIARETMSAMRKDVTAKLYGGDVTRKQKLLKKQKAGKTRLKKIGRVEIPQKAFLALMGR